MQLFAVENFWDQYSTLQVQVINLINMDNIVASKMIDILSTDQLINVSDLLIIIAFHYSVRTRLTRSESVGLKWNIMEIITAKPVQTVVMVININIWAIYTAKCGLIERKNRNI